VRKRHRVGKILVMENRINDCLKKMEDWIIAQSKSRLLQVTSLKFNHHRSILQKQNILNSTRITTLQEFMLD